MAMDENSIVFAVQNGQREEFAKLYDLYAEKIYRYIYFRIQHRETAEDLTSTVFFKALGAIQSFRDGEGTFSSWIYAIARNTLYDFYRAKKTDYPLEDILGIATSHSSQENIDAKIELESVRKRFSEFSLHEREVILMRIWDGLSYEEIAEITKRSEASLKMSFSRAIRRLRKHTGAFIMIVILAQAGIQ